MSELSQGLLGLGLAILVLLDGCLIVGAYIYSRYVFSWYLRTHHTVKWQELVHGEAYRGPSLFAFDKTRAIAHFRAQETDDLGDPKVAAMRRKSLRLFRAAIALWLVIVAGGLIAGLALLVAS